MDRQKRDLAHLRPRGDPDSSKAAGDSGKNLDMLAKAQEFFQTCDVENKGFIVRHDMQRLHGELPLSLEELEKVFDTLDADGNGLLTPEEFTRGFGQFLFGRKESVSEIPRCENENIYQPKWKESNMKGTEEEEQFSNLMERLGASNALEDEIHIKELWLHLKKDEPYLLSGFEEFLARVFSQLQEADNEKNALECALKRKITSYDEEIQHLYEEMEQQIKSEKDKFLLKDTERFQTRSQELEHKLVAKEQELEQLAQKQKRLEGQCKDLHTDKHDTKVENMKLKLTNQELQNELERVSQELAIAQQQLQIILDEARQLQEDKEIEVYRVTETLQREKSGLRKQLDFLRERNKYLRDEHDMCLHQKNKDVPSAPWKQRSGSVIGKYLERNVSLKSQSSEDDDIFSTARRRNSIGLNGNLSVDSDPATGGEQKAESRKQFQRIISIEEDHLSQLLDRTDRQLTKCSEEDENVLSEMKMNGSQVESLPQQLLSPRGQPVGKETQSKDESFCFAPDRLFKIVFVGNSSVGKTCFLRRFSENRYFPDSAATVGVDYRVKTVIVENSQVALQLWDTAGQERYRSITKQFFRKADGVIVMYDVTSRDTFMAVKQWLVSIEEATGDNIPVLLLGNKIDKEKEREVPNGSGERLAKDYSLIFYECSALSGDNINEPVLHLARILKDQEDKVKEKTVQMHQGPKKKACCSRQ